MNNSYITIIKEKRTDLSRKRIPLNQNGCTADFRMSVPFEQNLQSKRKEVYEAAKAEHPERWNGRATRDWSLPDTVYLNPKKVHEQSEKADRQMAVS